MPTSKPSLINANLKTFMRTPALRIEKSQSLHDLLDHTSFGIRCHTGKLSMKVEEGHLVKRCYTKGKKES
ncbi:hypothetical protein A152_0016455 [Vibrio tasmaniensis 1F-187]|uniref:hypothetical protein n=1 Tax=Vibrio TaxID=662 RepID=UPI000314A051|nr:MULTISPECIES: hypothetical protein [Vibrio]